MVALCTQTLAGMAAPHCSFDVNCIRKLIAVKGYGGFIVCKAEVVRGSPAPRPECSQLNVPLNLTRYVVSSGIVLLST